MGYKKGHVKTKTEDINCIIKLRFRQNVIKLKKECKRLCLSLLKYNEASDDAICVLSSSDYEIREIKSNCSEDNENYFLHPDSYELLLENSKYDW